MIVLEKCTNSIPSHIAVYISEHKVKTTAEAAVLADEYVLTHRSDFQAPESGVYHGPGRPSTLQEDIFSLQLFL